MDLINQSDSFDSEYQLFVESNQPYKPVELSYKLSDLEPDIDRKTMDYHYNHHYKGYIKKLNELVKSHKPLIELIKNPSSNEKIRFNAGDTFNHQLFWKMINPTPGSYDGQVKQLVDDKFGSYSKFISEFTEKATTIKGSGWCWLVKKGNSVDIVTTPNQDNPLMENNDHIPLLGCDMWEHSHYLKHGPNKKGWIEDFFKVYCWQYANMILQSGA